MFWRRVLELKKSVQGTEPVSGNSASQGDAFAVLMGPNMRKTLPRFLLPGRKSIYLFDAWPGTHKRVALFAEACRVSHLFLSSRQGAKMLGEILPQTVCHWLPEGVNPQNYQSLPNAKKNIDVLQLGRRFDRYHQEIVAPLQKAGAVYLYEKAPGQIIFPTRAKYIEGLSRSKISICVPSTLTHPGLAGGIETMTVRYLQSMLSRCLIVGHAPDETIELFGYNPVVEIDFGDPVKQLTTILRNMGDYSDLIEKNYQMVLEHHTWKHRWDKIASLLAL